MLIPRSPSSRQLKHRYICYHPGSLLETTIVHPKVLPPAKLTHCPRGSIPEPSASHLTSPSTLEATIQPDDPESTSGLEELPVEVFRQVTSYLAFFDKKALQVTSKQCYLLAGPFTCPDILLWRLHCCRSRIPCHPGSDFISDVMELKARTVECLERATWIDLSQGQVARDDHLAFLKAWDSTDMLKSPRKGHRHLMWLVNLGPRPSGWQQTVALETRCAVLHKMVSNLRLLRPRWSLSKIFHVAANVERSTFGQAPEQVRNIRRSFAIQLMSPQATYQDECRRASSAYISPLLQPYFNEAFPRSTVAYFCLSFIANCAETVLNNEFPVSKGLRYCRVEAQWRNIRESVRDHIKELGTWMHAGGRLSAELQCQCGRPGAVA